jgi:membrane protease YdiL (CAAX protease family)
VLIGATVSPPLCWAAQALLHWLQDSGHIPTTHAQQAWPLNEISKAGFERFFNRSVQLAALLGLPLLVRASRGGERLLPPLRFSARSAAQLSIGFLLAGGILLALGSVYWKMGLYTLRTHAPWTALGAPLTAALGAGIGEELIFRGLILGMMLRTMGTRSAVFCSTFLFAIVHFIKPPDGLSIDPSQIEWSTGFWLLGRIASHFSQWDVLLAEFGTLFAVGWVLAWARVRTSALWASLGLHAGWVFSLKYFSQLTRTAKPLRDGDYLPWVGDNLKVGLVPLVIVLLTGLIVLLLLQAMQGEHPDDERSDET